MSKSLRMVTWEAWNCLAKSTTTTRPSRRSSSRIALCRSSFSIQNRLRRSAADLLREDTLGTSFLSRMAFGCLGEKFQSDACELIRRRPTPPPLAALLNAVPIGPGKVIRAEPRAANAD